MNLQQQQQIPQHQQSLIFPHGNYDSTCNYCELGGKGRICFGMTTEQLTVEDYQALIDHGWRRSGTFLYKPDNENKNTCCPQYTIRLDTTSFKPSKDNKSTIKKFNNYLENDVIVNKTTPTSTTASTTTTPTPTPTPKDKIISSTNKDQNEENEQISKLNKTLIEILFKNEIVSKFNNVDKQVIQNNLKIKENKKAQQSQSQSKYSISFGILNKYKSKFMESSITNDQILDYIINEFNNNSNDLLFKLKSKNNYINISSTKEQAETIMEEDFKKVKKTTNTTTIKNESKEPKHKLEITIHKPQCTNEIFNLYCKYQKIIHKETEEKTKQGFKRFLVDSPLIPIINPDENYSDYVYTGENEDDDEDDQGDDKGDEDSEEYDYDDDDDDEHKESDKKNKLYNIGKKLKTLKTREGDINTPKPGFGSFHQHYRIDGKLVGVGVIDILPKCLSSVYFFYDPDYNFLSLGKYSALQEIKWVQNVYKSTTPQLKYYYMGYYIHNCQKMKYKGNYQPSQLLCLETFKWVDFKKSIEILKDKRYSRFYFENDEPTSSTTSTTSTSTTTTKLTNYEKYPELIDKIKFRQGNVTFKFKDITLRFQNMIKQTVIDYINNIGDIELLNQLIFYFK